MSSGGPPTKEEIAARKKAEADKKAAREAEWMQSHPEWFNALQVSTLSASNRPLGQMSRAGKSRN